MKILISGSMRGRQPNDDEFNLFSSACESIGRKLAECGHSIIVGSENKETADYHVVKGFCSNRTRNDLTVYAYRSIDDETQPYLEIRNGLDEDVKFIDRKSPGNWSVNRVEQIKEADCVLLICGGDGTLQSGFVSPSLDKPVAALTCFNGAAKHVWERKNATYNDNKKISYLSNKLDNRWNTGNENDVIELIDLVYGQFKKKTNIISPMKGSFLVAFVFTLIFSWVFVFDRLDFNGIASLMVLMCISTLLGSIVKNIIHSLILNNCDHKFYDNFLIECGGSLIIGFSLCLLYLVSQGIVTGTINLTNLKKVEEFQRISIFMSIAGIYSGYSIGDSADNLLSLLNKSIAKMHK